MDKTEPAGCLTTLRETTCSVSGVHYFICNVFFCVCAYMSLCMYRFKYAVRSLRRQKRSIVRRKLAYKRAHCHSRDFWAEVGRLSKPERRSPPLVVDGVTGDKQIATLWANKLNVLYNTHSTMLRDKIRKTLIESCSPGQLFETSITIEDVIESIVHLKNGIKDSTTLSSDHLKSACCIVSDPLSDFFTSVLRHGYMPSAFQYQKV